MENDDEQLPEGQYLVRVREGNWEFEVSGPSGKFVLDQTDRFLDLFNSQERIVEVLPPSEESAKPPSAAEIKAAIKQVEKPDTLKEFIGDIDFPNNLFKILAYGYWSEIKLEKGLFTAEDILSCFRTAKDKAPANLKRDLSSLEGKGFLLEPTKNKDGGLDYQLSKSGMKEIKTLLGLV